MPVAWSSKFTNKDFPANYDDWTVEDKIKLFEDQVLGWQLGIADDIINTNADLNPHAGFAVLSILMSYFERIGKYLEGYTGKSQSKKYFITGFTNVFPELKNEDEVINLLYADVRCGMYHEAIIGGQIILTRNFNKPITVVRSSATPYIAIDPHTLTKILISHFNEYVQKISAIEPDNALLENFLNRFDSKKDSKKRKSEYVAMSEEEQLFS